MTTICKQLLFVVAVGAGGFPVLGCGGGANETVQPPAVEMSTEGPNEEPNEPSDEEQ